MPTPANRIKTDPAAQTRSLVVAVVAIAAILAVVLVAFLLSSLGGDDTPPGSQGTDPTATTEGVADSTADGGSGNGADETPTLGASGLDVTPGIVPNLVGQQEDVASLAVVEAGYVVMEQRVADSEPVGTVIDQSPAPDIELPVGSTVVIVISEGQ